MRVKILDFKWGHCNIGNYINRCTCEIKFSIDDKSNYLRILRETYFDSEGDGKGDGYCFTDLSSGLEVYNSLWKGWMNPDFKGSRTEDWINGENWLIEDKLGFDIWSAIENSLDDGKKLEYGLWDFENIDGKDLVNLTEFKIDY